MRRLSNRDDVYRQRRMIAPRKDVILQVAWSRQDTRKRSSVAQAPLAATCFTTSAWLPSTRGDGTTRESTVHRPPHYDCTSPASLVSSKQFERVESARSTLG